MNIEQLDRLAHAACRYVHLVRKSQSPSSRVMSFEDLCKAAETPIQRQIRLEKLRSERCKHQTAFRTVWKGLGYAPLAEEVKLFPEDNRRFDFAHIGARVAIEIQGGIWKKGGHSTGKGIMRDCRKAFDATMLGWVVLQLTPDMIGVIPLQKIRELILKRLKA